MKLRPLGDRVLVKAMSETGQTSGGVVIPDTAQEKPQEGKIMAVGPGMRDKKGKTSPMEVKSGDRILFGKYTGTEVKLEGEEYLIMRESDILAIL